MIKYKRYPETEKGIEYGEKAHKMDLNKYEYVKVVLESQDKELLHEAALAYINTLSYNACWDFVHKEKFLNGLYINEICFKWNGCISAVDACAKLRFCNLQVKWKFHEKQL